jgi:hypothetical protein
MHSDIVLTHCDGWLTGNGPCKTVQQVGDQHTGYVLAGLMVFLPASSAALTDECDRLRDLNIREEADPSGSRTQIAARSQIGSRKYPPSPAMA